MGNKILLRDTSGNRLLKKAKANQTELVSTTDATLTVQTQTISPTPVGGGAAGNPGGSDTQIQFNDGGLFGGNPYLTFNKTNYSSVIGSCESTIDSNSCQSTIIGGYSNYIGYYSNHSSILGGKYHELYAACRSSIIGGCGSNVGYSKDVSIIGGCNHAVYQESCGSTIIGGHDGRITSYSCNSSLIAGAHNYIGDNLHNSTIVGGYRSCLYNNSCDSSIIASRYSCLTNSKHSAIIGGTSLTLDSKDDTVLVPNLQVNANIGVNSGGTFVNGITGTFSGFTILNGIIVGAV